MTLNVFVRNLRDVQTSNAQQHLHGTTLEVFGINFPQVIQFEDLTVQEVVLRSYCVIGFLNNESEIYSLDLGKKTVVKFRLRYQMNSIKPFIPLTHSFPMHPCSTP